jgi:hypothetical protein
MFLKTFFSIHDLLIIRLVFRFPNNVVLLKTNSNYQVAWISDIHRVPGSSNDNPILTGFVFGVMSPVWTVPLITNMADGSVRNDGLLTSEKIYSWVASRPKIQHRRQWSLDVDVVGKCMALPIVPVFPKNTDSSPHPDLEMVVTLLHHCFP